MSKVEELYREQIKNCEDEIYIYLKAIEELTFEAMNVHTTLNERKNKLEEYLKNETF